MRIVNKNSGCQVALCGEFSNTKVVAVNLELSRDNKKINYPAFYILCKEHEQEIKSLKTLKTRGSDGIFNNKVVSVISN